MEELTEVITAAEFHPIECSTFAYSSSKGTVRLCDMRQSALCDSHSKSKSMICAFCFISFASLLWPYIMSPSYRQLSHQDNCLGYCSHDMRTEVVSNRGYHSLNHQHVKMTLVDLC